MTQSLFRSEVVDAERGAQLGEVIGAGSLPAAMLTAALTVIVLFLVNYLCWGEYTRKAHVSGFLTPSKGLIKVYPPVPAVVTESHAVEGQQVQTGDVLLVLSTERATRSTPKARAAVIEQSRVRRQRLRDELQQQLAVDLLNDRSMETRRGAMRAELEHLAAELETQRQKLAAAEDSVERLNRLFKRKAISRLSWQDAERDALEQRSDLQRLQRQRLKLQRESEALRIEQAATALAADRNRSAMEREIVRLEQELTEQESRSHSVVVAPRAGRVSNVLAAPGQTVTPGVPLLSIVPAGDPLVARLAVPSRSVGFIRAGQAVSLRYRAFPHQRFGSYSGVIERVPQTLLMPGEAQLPIALQEPVYLVDVRLDSESVTVYGQAMPLQTGLALDADIWLDRRRLIEWVLEPLISLRGRV